MAIQYHYGSFPPSSLDWNRIIPLVGPVSAAIARYDGILGALPNASLLLSPLTTQEAVLSSRIEGTQATMGEVLEYEAAGDTGKFDESRKADINEVLNYRQAMREAIHLLDRLPLSQRVIRELHRILLSGVRGQNKSPGEYRKTPNWIGPAGCSIEDAYFVPISADKLLAGMDNWEKFIHVDFLDTLVQLALLHVEFEALHPFLDGNGRIGRMFIPLFLWQKHLISQPMFYASAVFERDRDSYYEHLRSVSQKNLWTEWCIFFLISLRAQAEENTKKAMEILKLYDKMKETIPRLINSQYTIHTIEWIFNVPIFMGSNFIHQKDISQATARRILPLLVEGKVLKIIEPARGRRSALYAFPELLNLAEGRKVF